MTRDNVMWFCEVCFGFKQELKLEVINPDLASSRFTKVGKKSCTEMALWAGKGLKVKPLRMKGKEQGKCGVSLCCAGLAGEAGGARPRYPFIHGFSFVQIQGTGLCRYSRLYPEVCNAVDV